MTSGWQPPEPEDALGQAARIVAEHMDPDPGDNVLPFGVSVPDYGIDAEQSADEGDDAEQLSFFAGAPEWALVHPRPEEIANETWMVASAAIHRMLDELLQFEELSHLAGQEIQVCWRRATAPFRKTRRDSIPVLASVTIVPPRAIWQALKEGCENYPTLWVDLHWAHWELRRKGGDDGLRYVHRDEVRRAIHHALSEIGIDGTRLMRVGADVTEFAATVQRFGVHGEGLRALRRQLNLWPQDDEG